MVAFNPAPSGQPREDTQTLEDIRELLYILLVALPWDEGTDEPLQDFRERRVMS